MKALIRNIGETILENSPIEIDWETGAPLTNQDWSGGPYTLVENYIPPADITPPNMVNPDRVEKIAELKRQLVTLENDL